MLAFTYDERDPCARVDWTGRRPADASSEDDRSLQQAPTVTYHAMYS
jgi:hypothetical protein